MERVDVVVVGAGPGGSVFARKAAEGGLRVVVLEKRQAVGEHVRCGEALGWHDLREMGIKPDRGFCVQRTKSTAIISPSGRRFSFKPGGEGYVVERMVFDKKLAAAAASAGARILTRTRAVGVKREGKGIIVKAERLGKKLEFECSLVVAADGIESRVAKWFGVDTKSEPADAASCVQVEVAGVKIKKPSEVEVYVGGTCPGGYIWVFPKGNNRANVGLGLPVSFAEKSPEVLLTDFLERRGWDKASIVQDSCGIITCGLPLREFTRDNLMIVGTAARQVSPLDGGGMGCAMEAARIAAEVALKAFKARDFSKEFLGEYDRKWYEAEGSAMKNKYKARKAASALSDDEVDYLVENLDKLDLSSFSRGKGFAKAIAFLMKKPALMRIARYLV